MYCNHSHKYAKHGTASHCKWWWTVCLLLSGNLVWAAELTGVREYQVKSVLLFNFANYTTWPASAFQADNTPFRICVFGEDPFRTQLDTTVKEETVEEHLVMVERFNSLQKLRGCHILFLSRSEQANQAKILAEAQKYPILTVGDNPEFIQQGGMVEFYNQGNKVRFAVDPEAITATGLKMSGNLLHIARIVRRIK